MSTEINYTTQPADRHEVNYSTSAADSYKASYITYDPDKESGGYGNSVYGGSRYGDSTLYTVGSTVIDTAVKTSMVMSPKTGQTVLTDVVEAVKTSMLMRPKTSTESIAEAIQALKTSMTMTPKTSTEILTERIQAVKTSMFMTAKTSTETVFELVQALKTSMTMTPKTAGITVEVSAPDFEGNSSFTGPMTVFLKLNDSKPDFKRKLVTPDGFLNVTDTEIMFYAKDRFTKEIVYQTNAEIVNGSEGEVRVEWDMNGFENDQSLLGEFVVTYSDGSLTVPTRGFIPIEIVEDIESRAED